MLKKNKYLYQCENLEEENKIIELINRRNLKPSEFSKFVVKDMLPNQNIYIVASSTAFDYTMSGRLVYMPIYDLLYYFAMS